MATKVPHVSIRLSNCQKSLDCSCCGLLRMKMVLAFQFEPTLLRGCKIVLK